MMGFGMQGWGGWGWVGLLWLFFWLLFVVGLIFLIRYLWPPAQRPREDSALDILNRRYARGEIDQEEFKRRKEDLRP